jgi:hypothetical protein
LSTKSAFPFMALICAGLVAASPAAAQPAATSTLNDPIGRHHQLQYQMMNDMTRQMTQMTEQMSRGTPDPQERRKMGEQMSRMAKMMRFMEGLAARPAHSDAQLQRQMDQMRAQMKAMTGGSPSEAR